MNEIEPIIDKLFDFCKKSGFSGYDPYDGLNSKIFQFSPFYRFKLSRQLWTQFIKKLPINLRPLLLISPQANPKTLALFILGLLNIYRLKPNAELTSQISELLNKLKKFTLSGYSGNCWGYNFPWQSRAFFCKKNIPNAICTIFAVEAILMAYEINKDEELLTMAQDSVNFFLNDLRKSYVGLNEICFSYTPIDNSCVHNINFMAAYILSFINKYSQREDLKILADNAARFSANRQNKDGSWYYGTAENQRWIDNFHTGYNLIALKRYTVLTKNTEFLGSLKKGYEFFDNHFFLKNSVAKYYPDRTYPIDIHSVATSIITYHLFADYDKDAMNKAKGILKWAITYLYDKKGFFYFQKYRTYSIKIPYMRWSQAWMFYAASCLL